MLKVSMVTAALGPSTTSRMTRLYMVFEVDRLILPCHGIIISRGGPRAKSSRCHCMKHIDFSRITGVSYTGDLHNTSKKMEFTRCHVTPSSLTWGVSQRERFRIRVLIMY